MTPPPLDCLYRARVRTAQACRPAHQALQLNPTHHATLSKRPAWLSLTASSITQASHTHLWTHCSRCRTACAALPAGARLGLLSAAALGDAVDDLALNGAHCGAACAGLLAAGARLGLLGARAVGECVDERALALAGRRALARLLARQRRVELAAGRRGHARLPGRGLDLRAAPGFRP